MVNKKQHYVAHDKQCGCLRIYLFSQDKSPPAMIHVVRENFFDYVRVKFKVTIALMVWRDEGKPHTRVIADHKHTRSIKT